MSRTLIFGTVGRNRLAVLSPIGVVDGREIFPLRGAEDDPAGNGGDGDSDDESEDDEDGSEEDDEDAKDDDSKNQRRKPSAKKPANAAFAAMKRELNTLKREKRDRDNAERTKALADKPELERLTAERDDAVKGQESLAEKYREAQIELAISRASNGSSKYSWADLEDVLNDRTLRNAIDIDDDGEVSGVEEALKDLAKRKPHFLAKKSEEDEKGKGKPGTNGNRGTGKTGQQPGTGGSSGDREADRQKLESKYSVLGGMVPN